MSDPAIGTVYTLCNSLEMKEAMERRGVCVREKERQRAEDGCYREGPVKSKEKGLATLHGVIHCAPEIITEPSKSSFNAPIEEKEKHSDNKRETDIHRHSKQAKSKKHKKDYFKSFIESVISGIKLS